MLVGVPKEIKDNEYRVGLVPSTVRELTDKGHQALVEAGAGSGAGLSDGDYKSAGAEIVCGLDERVVEALEAADERHDHEEERGIDESGEDRGIVIQHLHRLSGNAEAREHHR